MATALAVDAAGFLWIGTQRGLVRWDGYAFRTFAAHPDDPRSIPGSYVRSLLAARDGRLWIGTFASGLAVYDPATDRFRRFAHAPADPESLAHDRVEGLAEDAAGGIWVATYGGLDRIDAASGRIRHFRHRAEDPVSLADDRVRAVLVDGAGTVWVGSRDGLQRWRGGEAGFARVASDPGVAGSLAGQFVSRLFTDSRGRLWIGTNEDGAAVLDPRSGELVRFPARPGEPRGLSHFWVYGFAEVARDELWVATFGGGIDVIDGASLRVVARLRHDPAVAASIGSDRVGALLRDPSGQVWVATWGQGLARHHPSERAFAVVRQRLDDPVGLSHPSAVRPLARRDGTLWVGTNGNGVDVLDAGLRRVGGFRPDRAAAGELSDGGVTCLEEGPDGAVWTATLDGNLHRLAPGATRWDRLTPGEGLAGGPIRALTFGPAGALWAGSAEGLTRIDLQTLRARVVERRTGEGGAPLHAAVEAIAFTRDGTRWLGTDSGLEVVAPGSAVTVRVVRQEGRGDQLPSNWVPDLLVARDGRLWVGTQGGACRVEAWDGRELRCPAVAERVGRPPAPAEALLEDAEGWVWIGASLRVDPRSWRAQEFGAAEGCDPRTFYIASRARTADGRLLFGSPEGLVVVRPSRLAAWRYAPPVVATAVRVEGAARPGAGGLRALTLSPNERRLEVDFAALDLSAPARNAYRYRLDGLDREWRVTDAARRTAAYTNLRPGRYTLRVAGSNRTGAWSPHQLRIAVTVLPAFYQTTWLRALVAAASAALLWALVRLRIRRLEARGRELERQVGERTRDLAERNAELAVAYRRIEEASLTDPLTGLRNRRFLEQSIGADLELALRRQSTREPADLLFLLLDLDHFKSVNDTYGHAAGDAVLVQTAAALRRVVRAADHVVRWGGEEFLVVARFVDREHGRELAEKVRAEIAATPFALPGGEVLRRTCSLGFTAFPFDPASPQALDWERVVHAADLCLYLAKRRGRDGWVGVAATGQGEATAALAELERDAEAAVAAGAVRLFASRGGS